jgi:hypothetical protein
MVGTRKPGKGQNMEINESDMYTNAKNNQQLIKLIYFWMKLGAS